MPACLSFSGARLCVDAAAGPARDGHGAEHDNAADEEGERGDAAAVVLENVLLVVGAADVDADEKQGL